MNAKICTKCGEEKVATSEFFHKDKKGKYGLRGECKSCYKIYVQQNKEKISKRRKQYRKANKDKIAEYDKQHYQDNKEKILEYHKQYNQANKEKRKQYREANKDKISKRMKQYRKENRHLLRQQGAKRRAAKLKQTPDYANHGLIKLIYENCPKGYQVDHMIPISKGGLHHESNLCYLPASINITKGAKTIEEFGEEEFNRNVIYWQDKITNNDKLDLQHLCRTF